MSSTLETSIHTLNMYMVFYMYHAFVNFETYGTAYIDIHVHAWC